MAERPVKNTVALTAQECSMLKEEFTRCLKLKNLDPQLKGVLSSLQKGEAVWTVDALLALCSAMRCAISANGQSMGRRADGNKIHAILEAVWFDFAGVNDTNAPFGTDYDDHFVVRRAELGHVPDDLTNRDLVETWLDA